MSDPNDSTPPRKIMPLLLSALAGFLVGGAVASGVWLYLLNEQQQRHQAELAAVTLKIDPMGLLPSVMGKLAPGGVQVKPDSEENKVLEFGKAFVADLENDRLASAYRSTSENFQRQMDRMKFDEMVGKYPAVRHLYATASEREHKVRKQLDGKGYEYYCTAHDLQAPAGNNRVNFALMITQEGDEWRVSELEITAENKP